MAIPMTTIARCAAAAMAAGIVLAGVSGAAAAPAGEGDDKLSGRLSILSELPTSSDPAEAQSQIEATFDSLAVAASGPGSLQVTGDSVAVTVYYSAPPTASDIASLEALGTVRAVAAKYLVVDASVPTGQLTAVAALPNVTAVEENPVPLTSGSATAARESSAPAAPAAPEAPDDSCRTVPANLADPLNVPLARELYGVDGTGVRVGIISDSFDRARSPRPTTPDEDISLGMLPGPGNPCGYTQPVEVLKDTSVPGGLADEGRAMAQLIHSIAPGSTLMFSTGDGPADFASSVEELAEAGADIIVDDIGYLNEPMFQDGPVSNSVSDAVALGIPFFTAAGNDTSIGLGGASEGAVISSWETPEYRPMECPTTIDVGLAELGITAADCLDFDPGAGEDATDSLYLPNLASVGGSQSFMLQWGEPLGAAETRLLGAFVDSTGSLVALTPAPTDGFPVQYGNFAPSGGTYDFIVVRDTSTGAPTSLPRVKAIFTGGNVWQAEYFESRDGDIVGPSIYGHAGTPAAVGVAAASAQTPTTLERFSGTGPITLYFEPYPGTDALPAPFRVGAPTLTGVDDGWTDFFGEPVEGQEGVYSFTGTSAAAPSVAAVAALGLQLRPAATEADVRTALLSTAQEIPGIVPSVTAEDSAGAGLVDAAGFLAALPEPAPEPTPAPTPVPSPVPVPTPAPVPVPAGGPSAELAATGAATGTAPAITAIGSALAIALLALGTGTVLARRRA
ncbi:S8 family serine peptidase [Herbiconiux sp. P15]|uniref:S8 family serine peptidase n=1 Tax=Herbiconiux liukaitaii TaxID=3342799 RepID=UPI0035B889E5